MSAISRWNRQDFWDALHRRSFKLKIDSRVVVRFDQEDLVNETFAKAVEADGGENPFRGETDGQKLEYLFKIQSNLLIDMHRKHLDNQGRGAGREQDVQAFNNALTESYDGIAGIEGDQTTPSEAAVDNEQIAWLAKSIPTLPGREKEAMNRRIIDNQSIAEIAKAMEISEAAVGGLIFRATQRLREMRPDVGSSGG